MAFDGNINIKSVWREWEVLVTDASHQMSLEQVCQANWASVQQKPKQTTAAFNKMLFQTAFDRIDSCPLEGLLHIMQGFKNKQNKAMYMRVRQTLIDRRKTLFPAPSKKNPKADSSADLINTFFMFAVSRPKNFGVYKVYASEELDELIAHYEHDLCEAAEKADAEGLTRIAQALYILKTGEFENIWWRIESRANDLAQEGKLDFYNVHNILRAFSRSQHNQMTGKDKTFYNLEPVVMKGLESANSRDASHVMYSYAIRNAGNPELYKAFDKWL